MKKLLLTIIVAAALSLSACGKTSVGNEIEVPILETKEQTFNTVKAEISDISRKYYLEGSYGYPYYEMVSFKQSGQIESINVESEDEVEKGQLLFTLNTDAVQEQIEEKEIYLEQAKKTLSTLQSKNGNAAEIEMAKIDLDIQQLEYDHLVDSLDDYNVYAPCSGRFSMTRDLNVYNYVNAGEVIGMAVDNSKQYLCCNAYDVSLEDVNFGTEVLLTQGAHESKGIVTDIIYNESGDYSSNIYVISPDEDADFFDFEEVEVCFDVYSRLDTVVVPSEAVKMVGKRDFVNLLVDGVKVEQDVELGISDGDNVEILSGLSGGEEIILN